MSIRTYEINGRKAECLLICAYRDGQTWMYNGHFQTHPFGVRIEYGPGLRGEVFVIDRNGCTVWQKAVSIPDGPLADTRLHECCRYMASGWAWNHGCSCAYEPDNLSDDLLFFLPLLKGEGTVQGSPVQNIPADSTPVREEDAFGSISSYWLIPPHSEKAGIRHWEGSRYVNWLYGAKIVRSAGKTRGRITVAGLEGKYLWKQSVIADTPEDVLTVCRYVLDGWAFNSNSEAGASPMTDSEWESGLFRKALDIGMERKQAVRSLIDAMYARASGPCIDILVRYRDCAALAGACYIAAVAGIGNVYDIFLYAQKELSGDPLINVSNLTSIPPYDVMKAMMDQCCNIVTDRKLPYMVRVDHLHILTGMASAALDAGMPDSPEYIRRADELHSTISRETE